MTAREVLLAAANHLERHGWQRGERGGALGPCCVLGALGVGAEYDSMTDANYKRYMRTAAEVIAALRGAAGSAP